MGDLPQYENEGQQNPAALIARFARPFKSAAAPGWAGESFRDRKAELR